MNNILVTASWLHARLDDKNLVILDASSLGIVSETISDESGVFIPGARKYDLKEIPANCAIKCTLYSD